MDDLTINDVLLCRSTSAIDTLTNYFNDQAGSEVTLLVDQPRETSSVGSHIYN